MFCDLVGSTALSTRHDPEDLRELIGGYHRAVAEAVAGFDGFVAKYMGDGVLIYFGYPQAHEDDAERAVRAGLAVIEAVGRLPARQDLRVRLGVATGLAVVGDLIGEGAAQRVVGETPNLAARLQALAMPNTLVIAEATRRQIGGLFDLADLGPQALAGFAEPQPAWRVIGESGMLSRFEALRSGETPLVGRDEEVELLLRRWQQAKSGEGRVVLISGEPGIGKSRLTAALSEHIGSEPHTRLRYFCSPHHQDSALYPFIAQLERAAGFARDDAVEARLGKLRALLAPGARDDDDIALLTELLSLPSSAADLNLSPQRKREKLFEAVLGQLEAEARRRPVLMVFEDAHWIDPTSRELLDLTVDRVRHLPVLLAITFRPEFQPPWGGRAHVTSLALNRLGERDGEALVQTLAGNAALTAEIVAEIVERTDGVPLFVEELTKAVLESAAQGDRVAAVLATTSVAALSVPATLHASLMARLDRLGPAPKEIAQIGAVLGREFAYELIEPVAQRPETRIASRIGSARRCGIAVLPRYRSARLLSVQARAGAGRRLLDPVARATAGIARARRGGAGTAFFRSRRAPAGAARPSPDGCRRHRTRGRSMAEGGAACRGATGLPRSNCPSQAGSRPAAFATGEPGPQRSRNRIATGVGALSVSRQGRRRSEAGLYAGARACREQRRAAATV